MMFKPLSTILQLYRGGFIGGGKTEYPEKPTDLAKVTDKLYHIIIEYTSLERDSNSQL